MMMITIFSIITLPDNFVASSTQTASTLFTDLSPVLVIIFGLLIGAAVIGILLSFFTRR